MVKASMSSPTRGFDIASTAAQGLGAFATNRFFEENLVLIEEPLCSVAQGASPEEIIAAVGRLSEDDRTRLFELASDSSARSRSSVSTGRTKL